MKRVLVADHSLFTKSILRKLLSRTEFQIVAEAKDGKQAVNKFIQLNPDIVLMELILPKMNGLQALEQMIKHDSTANVIIYSARYEPFLSDESKHLGARDFLLKPDFIGLLSSLSEIEHYEHS